MTINSSKEVKTACPGCGKTEGVFENGDATLTTEGITLIPYWCSSCMHPFHIYKKNGKVVNRSEF